MTFGDKRLDRAFDNWRTQTPEDYYGEREESDTDFFWDNWQYPKNWKGIDISKLDKVLKQAIEQAKKEERERIIGILDKMQEKNTFYLNKAIEMIDLKRKPILINLWKAIIDYTKEIKKEVSESE